MPPRCEVLVRYEDQQGHQVVARCEDLPGHDHSHAASYKTADGTIVTVMWTKVPLKV